MKKVLLINMPFCTTRNPALGISLLKSLCSDDTILCDIKYLNIDFAEMMDQQLDMYEEICSFSPKLLGERLFAQEYFNNQLPDIKEYIAYANQSKHYTGQKYSINELLSIGKFVKPFLDYCLKSINWQKYDIIGFTTMFEQNLASIALSHKIKNTDPTKTIIFGGANCEGDMGLELHKCFPFIDYVFTGEADYSFPEFVKRISHKESFKDIPGIIYRNNGNSTLSSKNKIVTNLNQLPCPDYDDYFAQLEQSSFSSSVCEEVHLETSRGCWWGEKSQCRFCGLNGASIEFRSKSKNKVMSDLDSLLKKYVKKYNIPLISVVDNILDMQYFKDLLPELKKRDFKVPLFFETKSNLNKKQVRMLSEAGVTFIQPGIESLNTHVLKLMSKGVSSLQNIQLLTYCNRFGVLPQWYILSGFPGEKSEDYIQLIELIYKITHLPPPDGHGHIILQRFSPYFNNAQKFGIVNVRPDGYQYIYPFESAILFNLAYFFEFDYKNDLKPPDWDAEIGEALAYWQECYANNENLYSYELSPSSLLIEDSRSNAISPQIVLKAVEKDIYEYCDQIRTFSSIFSTVKKKYGNEPVRERDVRDFLENMMELNFMIGENNKYLSLAIPFDEQPLEIQNTIIA